MRRASTIVRAPWLLLTVAAIAAFGDAGDAAPDQDGPKLCDAGTGSAGPDADLYCIELLPAGNLDARRRAPRTCSLRPSPFGVAVTPAGEHVYDVRFDVQGLPAPSTLGPYRTYVAWATTPQMHPLVKLGEIGNGRATLGPHQLRSHAHPHHRRGVGRGARIVKAAWCCAARRPRFACSRTTSRFCWPGLLDRADAPASDHTHHATGGSRAMVAAADASTGHDAAGADDAETRRRAVRPRAATTPRLSRDRAS